jgi:endonuclease/exonuclease/phosphatase family metal-dependent hydrolase
MASLRKRGVRVHFKNVACIAGMIFSAVFAQASSSNVVLYASKAPVKSGTWAVVADSTAAGGYAIGNPNLGAAKISTALATPKNYFQLSFPAYSGRAYHLWIRARSLNNATSNDSVYVQFSDSVNSSKTAVYRIGTTSAAPVILQSCSGATIQGWGWTDNGWCGLGSAIYFQSSGTHTIRVQTREDGLSIDQIVLSPQTYLSAAPGKTVNDTIKLAANLPALSSTYASITTNPTSGSAPLSVNFTANVTLSSGSVSAYNWSFGDSQTSTAASPSHIYQISGNYTPTLKITTSAGATASASTLLSVSGSSSSIKLRVMQANIFYGGHGTDDIANLSRDATWIANMNPDVVSLIEVLGGSNDPQTLTSLVKQKTGISWYYSYVPKYPGCVEGVMILSKWPIVSTSQYFMSYQMPIAQATLNVGGKYVNFFSTHFQWPSTSSSQRQVEANELVSFASSFSEPRIIAGDFNAQDGTPEINIVEQKYLSGWNTAVSHSAAVAYSDNPPNLYTRTRKSRIDHVFYSKGATNVSVTAGKVPDTRNLAIAPVIKIGTSDDKGVRPSDHNFMTVDFTVY